MTIGCAMIGVPVIYTLEMLVEYFNKHVATPMSS